MRVSTNAGYCATLGPVVRARARGVRNGPETATRARAGHRETARRGEENARTASSADVVREEAPTRASRRRRRRRRRRRLALLGVASRRASPETVRPRVFTDRRVADARRVQAETPGSQPGRARRRRPRRDRRLTATAATTDAAGAAGAARGDDGVRRRGGRAPPRSGTFLGETENEPARRVRRRDARRASRDVRGTEAEGEGQNERGGAGTHGAAAPGGGGAARARAQSAAGEGQDAHARETETPGGLSGRPLFLTVSPPRQPRAREPLPGAGEGEDASGARRLDVAVRARLRRDVWTSGPLVPPRARRRGRRRRSTGPRRRVGRAERRRENRSRRAPPRLGETPRSRDLQPGPREEKESRRVFRASTGALFSRGETIFGRRLGEAISNAAVSESPASTLPRRRRRRRRPFAR